MSTTDRKEIIEKYLAALAKGDSRQILTFFSPDAVVHSPLYSLMKAVDFYRELSRDTTQSKIRLIGIFADMEREDRAAAHGHFVHVFVGGGIVAEGGPELAQKLEAEGYEAFTPTPVGGE